MNSICGIDPGKSGGLAVLSPAGEIQVTTVMPINSEGVVDYFELLTLFEDFKTMGDHVILEDVGGRCGDGAKGAFSFGRGMGIIECAIKQSGLKVTYVKPTAWAKVIHEGLDKDLKPKAKSRTVISRLFPNTDFKRTPKCKNPHDGLVDAVLIAEWGRRTL